jgi:hypothetical protein
VVKARRAINSKNPGKGTEEVIIYNWFDLMIWFIHCYWNLR